MYRIYGHKWYDQMWICARNLAITLTLKMKKSVISQFAFFVLMEISGHAHY